MREVSVTSNSITSTPSFIKISRLAIKLKVDWQLDFSDAYFPLNEAEVG